MNAGPLLITTHPNSIAHFLGINTMRQAPQSRLSTDETAYALQDSRVALIRQSSTSIPVTHSLRLSRALVDTRGKPVKLERAVSAMWHPNNTLRFSKVGSLSAERSLAVNIEYNHTGEPTSVLIEKKDALHNNTTDVAVAFMFLGLQISIVGIKSDGSATTTHEITQDLHAELIPTGLKIYANSQKTFWPFLRLLKFSSGAQRVIIKFPYPLNPSAISRFTMQDLMRIDETVKIFGEKRATHHKAGSTKWNQLRKAHALSGPIRLT